MNISDEAVEAAAKVAWDRTHDMPWTAAAGGWKLPYLREARAALEAAAPHIAAEAWDDGFDRGFYDPLAGRDRDASESQTPNPYRSQA